jgi:DNA-binding CsgD family transcriptional regulator
MDDNSENSKVDWDNQDANFYEALVLTLPIVICINRIDRRGDITSFRNIWTNRYGLNFIGTTQGEIYSEGYDFFRAVIHPTDLELMKVSLKDVYISGSKLTYEASVRIKPKGMTDYSLFRCSNSVQETFDDGTIKQVMVAAFEITPHDQQIVPALKEIGRLESRIKLRILSGRESEVLKLIVKGETDKEIANKLCISYSTVKTHRNNMIQKTGVKNTAELAALAIESGEF